MQYSHPQGVERYKLTHLKKQTLKPGNHVSGCQGLMKPGAFTSYMGVSWIGLVQRPTAAATP
jgi:hypothetical protein